MGEMQIVKLGWNIHITVVTSVFEGDQAMCLQAIQRWQLLVTEP